MKVLQVSKNVYINTSMINKIERSLDENMWVVTAGGSVYSIRDEFAEAVTKLTNKKD